MDSGALNSLESGFLEVKGMGDPYYPKTSRMRVESWVTPGLDSLHPSQKEKEALRSRTRGIWERRNVRYS